MFVWSVNNVIISQIVESLNRLNAQSLKPKAKEARILNVNVFSFEILNSLFDILF